MEGRDYHRPGQPYDDDEWELYHLDEDFSECHNWQGKSRETQGVDRSVVG